MSMKSTGVMDRIPPLPNDLEAIIFDCDGTLVDTMPFHLQAWEEICEETGLYFSKESFLSSAGIPGREIIRTMAKKQGIRLDVMNVYNRKKALYIQSMKKTSPASLPISCVVDFATQAKATNDSLLLGVATGSSRFQVEEDFGNPLNVGFQSLKELMWTTDRKNSKKGITSAQCYLPGTMKIVTTGMKELLELAGLRDLFDVVVGNEDYSRHKPSPDAFLTACEKLNVDPAKCWGLEDTEIGLESIRRAGLQKAIDVRLLSGYPVLSV